MNINKGLLKTWKPVIISLLVLCIAACNRHEKTKAELTTLNISEKYSLSLVLPDGWDVMTAKEIENMEERGIELLQETTGMPVESFHEYLLQIRKDAFNSLLINKQIYNPEEDGPYDELQEMLFEIVLETITAQGLSIEHDIEEEQLDGFAFKRLNIKLFDPKRDNKVILYQNVWDGLIGNHSVLINANYNNEKDEKMLKDMLREAKIIKH